jgi:hypothetical protein
MTSSARPSSDGGIVSPSALAVLRLIASSEFVRCSIEGSPGFAPFKFSSTASVPAELDAPAKRVSPL